MTLMMRAIEVPGEGPVRLTEIERPNPGPGEILIRVAAAGVNRPDLMQRRGFYPPPPGAPATLGLEAAGHVEACGPGVERWRPGDSVTALMSGGGYAEFALADEGAALPTPPGMTMAEAACLPETVFTVWANVFERGALKPGETLLVHGGASGIGTTAIQMAVALGARVLATAGSPEKVALCERLGAARAINYRTEDFAAVAEAEGGVDVILDMVGAPYLARNLSILKPDGRLVYIAFLNGARAEIDLMRLMLKRLSVTGSTLRIRPKAEKARLCRAIEAAIWPLAAAGRLKPVIDSAYPLAEADAALTRMEAGLHAGKIVLLTP
jgi:NADPH2:quinone reductase